MFDSENGALIAFFKFSTQGCFVGHILTRANELTVRECRRKRPSGASVTDGSSHSSAAPCSRRQRFLPSGVFRQHRRSDAKTQSRFSCLSYIK